MVKVWTRSVSPDYQRESNFLHCDRFESRFSTWVLSAETFSLWSVMAASSEGDVRKALDDTFEAQTKHLERRGNNNISSVLSLNMHRKHFIFSEELQPQATSSSAGIQYVALSFTGTNNLADRFSALTTSRFLLPLSIRWLLICIYLSILFY